MMARAKPTFEKILAKFKLEDRLKNFFLWQLEKNLVQNVRTLKTSMRYI